ncbi:hypothetical protein WICPIJ_007297 [Wickerhamomyces pijperi]|uniref:Uncharacterized protein n=1 Tax=Wickerhamomyces pijperi TaxID=599730 RepID=A0A9P8TJE1_WICPI|nr:hypothetical protein WICPIJ_007297 [Wickerhamomyces pijperi]
MTFEQTHIRTTLSSLDNFDESVITTSMATQDLSETASAFNSSSYSYIDSDSSSSSFDVILIPIFILVGLLCAVVSGIYCSGTCLNRKKSAREPTNNNQQGYELNRVPNTTSEDMAQLHEYLPSAATVEPSSRKSSVPGISTVNGSYSIANPLFDASNINTATPLQRASRGNTSRAPRRGRRNRRRNEEDLIDQLPLYRPPTGEGNNELGNGNVIGGNGRVTVGLIPPPPYQG